jgi:endoglucanase
VRHTPAVPLEVPAENPDSIHMRRLVSSLCLVGALWALAVTASPHASATTASPFASRTLLVVPGTTAARAAQAAEAAGDTARSRELSVIAKEPQALWITGGTGAPRPLAEASDLAVRSHRVLVAVFYAIPHRDCGAYSAGGQTAKGYRALIRAVAPALGRARAAVVLEPDSLALLPCLSPAQAMERYALLRDAVHVLSVAGAAVYIDAGHAHQVSAATMAARLRSAGVSGARGVAVNVSGYETTRDSTSYVREIALRLPGLHAVIDTSRNGLGATRDSQWCNAPGRALGSPPHAVIGGAVDALLWVKHPGESDGACARSEPAAGTFWPAYAEGLVQRTGWARVNLA